MAGIIRCENIVKNNIFDGSAKKNPGKEIFENIISSNSLKLERIISSGQTTPEGKWLMSKRGEWVILLKGKAELIFTNNNKIKLEAGDYLLIPAGCKHRVSFTSKKPSCVWLAIHTDFFKIKN